MEYLDTTDLPLTNSTDKAASILKKYKEAQNIKDYWKDKFEKHMSIVFQIENLFMKKLLVKKEQIKFLMKLL